MSEADDEQALERLAALFYDAVNAHQANSLDRAEDMLREIVRTEPRLAEPHLELGRICLDTDRLDEAEEHSREALIHLETGGAWTDEVPEETVKALAHAQLAEVLRRRADEDDVIFGDAEAFRAIVAESQEHFRLASTLDPSDDYSSYHAYFLGVPSTKLPGDIEDEELDE